MERVFLIGTHSCLANVEAGFPKGLYLDHYSFWLISIDLSDGRISSLKLFPADTSLFSIVEIECQINWISIKSK